MTSGNEGPQGPSLLSLPLLVPQDLQLFRESGGWDVVRAVAEFWCSRVEWNPGEEKYHLRGKATGQGGRQAQGEGGQVPETPQ